MEMIKTLKTAFPILRKSGKYKSYKTRDLLQTSSSFYGLLVSVGAATKITNMSTLSIELVLNRGFSIFTISKPRSPSKKMCQMNGTI